MKKSLTIIILFLLVLTLSITGSGCSKPESDCVKNCRGTISYDWGYDLKTSYCEFVCDET